MINVFVLYSCIRKFNCKIGVADNYSKQIILIAFIQPRLHRDYNFIMYVHYLFGTEKKTILCKMPQCILYCHLVNTYAKLKVVSKAFLVIIV